MKTRTILFLTLAMMLAMAVGYLASRVAVPNTRSELKTSKRSKPSLPAPKGATSEMASSSTREAPATNSSLLERLLKGDSVKITVAQLQGYLAQNKRDAESLLTASRLTDDLALLREAAQRFPNDPRVQLDLAMRSNSDAERQRAIAALVTADPANALGNYLAAGEAFNANNPDEAVRQLDDANARAALDDYMMLNVQSAEDAYLAAGYDAVSAKAVAMFGSSLGHATKLRELGVKMSDLAKLYASHGDVDSAQAISEMGIALGQRIQSSMSKFLISDLVGMSIEKRFLEGLDPSSVMDSQGVTVQQRLAQIAEHKALVGQLSRSVDPTSSQWSPQILTQYLERVKVFGEVAAMQWLQGKLK